jgi:hypothetical protein
MSQAPFDPETVQAICEAMQQAGVGFGFGVPG